MSKQELEVMDQDATCCPGLAAAPLDDERATELARVFKAMGDPVRLRLLSMIASREGGEVCVCEMTPAFDLSQPTISHHLKLLRQAGLIDCERRGTWVYYWAVPGALDTLAGFLTTKQTDLAARRTTGATRQTAGPTAQTAGATP
ncbi:ArsR/SmtB family transcription factor [Streptomyces acidicola]|uniref:Helix-turn-helix transcriptional regulator n=1 Tax=Streptomyces acidicola TaxID=2596892 RepID=A0A5N8WVK4_9ACTN|nr:metalloregulator ArsR/SmtB family transcription factor [Streptomyces acidicola]MPY51443.1 helix-turn-helix transcriptional regulator [Streptomyces acidicola]